MPKRIQFSAGHTTEYLYDADGRKLRTVHRTAVPNMSVPLNQTVELDATNTLGKDSTDYVGSFILRQGQLD
ncbi:MAG: RHS repeat-associated core domain-containing protein, partial [Prevotella sp.]|nr:RHS repeat-associated core domain-containing protein [Prevotella sp.]